MNAPGPAPAVLVDDLVVRFGDLTAVGGVMVHNVPAQGFFNHGLVNYSPKFFRMLARSNHYACLCMNFPDVSEAYGLPENIISRIREFDAQKAERAKAFRFCDAGLIVALKKEEDMDFVPPLDVPNGAAVADIANAGTLGGYFEGTGIYATNASGVEGLGFPGGSSGTSGYMRLLNGVGGSLVPPAAGAARNFKIAPRE